MKNSHFWILIIAMTAVMCLVDLALVPILFDTAAVAEVRQNGELIHTLPLNEPTQITVETADGGLNSVVVHNGSVCVAHATCPDKLCVKQGWVESAGTPIVCLPHGLVVEIKGGEQDIDAAAG